MRRAAFLSGFASMGAFVLVIPPGPPSYLVAGILAATAAGYAFIAIRLARGQVQS